VRLVVAGLGLCGQNENKSNAVAEQEEVSLVTLGSINKSIAPLLYWTWPTAITRMHTLDFPHPQNYPLCLSFVQHVAQFTLHA